MTAFFDTRSVAPALSRRKLMLGAGFVAVAGSATLLTPRHRQDLLGAAKLDDMAPVRFGAWRDAGTGGVILPENQVVASVYDRVLTRSYLAAGLPPVMLLIAYGAAQSGMMQVHRPEICYKSAGFRVDGDRTAAVPLGDGAVVPAKQFTARREQRVEPVLYWTRIADRFPTSLLAQRIVMLEAGLKGVLPDGLLVRISTLSSDADQSQRVLLHFARDLVGSGGPARRGFFAAGR